jgi:uncharacterized protein (TIGR02147 family)
VEKPNVFKYHDYLLFINDWIVFKQDSDNKSFSIRKWSQFIETSPSLITMILKRQRTLTDSLFFRMIQQMDLKKNEREALACLRLIANSESAEERSNTYNKLIKIPEYKKENSNNLKVFEYLSNWINVAIRELAFTNDFVDDPAWIKSRLRVHSERRDIEKALEFLKDRKYLYLDENSKWRPTENQMDCSEGVYKLSLTDFHRQMLNFAGDSINEVKRKDRYIVGHTFSVSKDQYTEAQSILEEALKRIENLNKSDNANDVYQIEIALFPLTNIKEEC